MDFSKLSSNERLAAAAAAVTVVAGAIAAGTYNHYSITWLAILLAVGMLAIIFLPQLSAGTSLPGSKGSLMVAIGGLAAIVMALAFLTNISFTFDRFGFPDALFLVAVAAAIVMGWAGWQALQAEGGKFTLGTGGAKADGAAPSAQAAAPPPASPPAASPPPLSEGSMGMTRPDQPEEDRSE